MHYCKKKKQSSKHLKINKFCFIGQVDLSFQLDKVKILPLSDENWPLNDHTYKRFCKIIGFGSVEGDRDKPSLHVNEVFAEHGYKACSGCTEG